MEQIALISDIHGNLPALKAVLDDIKDKGIKRILCLGDVIGKGPSNCEVLDICRDCCEIILKGNWEEYVSLYEPKESAIWVQEQIGKERLNYIRNMEMTKEMWVSGKFMRLFHSHPCGFKRVFAHSSVEEKRTLFVDDRGKYSDIAVYADIHRPYMQTIDNRVLFNTGSVGNPLDIPECSYVIMYGNFNSQKPSSYSINFIRLPYDINKAVEDAYSTRNMPDLEDYVNEITKCIYNRR